MQSLKVTHYGEDYATVEVGGEEFETSLGLGKALAEYLKSSSKAENISINKVSVRNFSSPRGSEVPNQFMITTPLGVYFQSYSSIIAYQPRNGKVVLDEKYWDYSKTTGKYRNQFLGEDKKETEKKIKSGEYILADLNQ